MYYLARVKFETFDDNTGRHRKINEQYLVEAESISIAEKSLHERFKDSIADFAVVGVQESKILGVIK